MLKLKSSSPTGWNAKWGVAPYVETENPDVLFYGGSRAEGIVISLSKPCVEFGFEIAANYLNSKHRFALLAGDYSYGESKGSVIQEIKRGPGGARLIMVKENIRYKLAK